jgi:transglutaminase-like putative cysteine protease
MRRYRIIHRTYYNFSGAVLLGPHTMRLRPREDHELRIESSLLNISPDARLSWHRDVEDNSVVTATFSTATNKLVIESEVVIQHFNLTPLDFVVADYAVNYPFAYLAEDWDVLAPYAVPIEQPASDSLADWIAGLWRPGEQIQTYSLLQRFATHIQQTIAYRRREEAGVQSALQTLSSGTGSCRDLANLFMEAVRHLGIASRFVSGYLHAQPSSFDYGATHAWVEVFLPGAGWKGFDPSLGNIVGTEHIAVAVARKPEMVPPVEGSFTGPVGANLDVGVWVIDL